MIKNKNNKGANTMELREKEIRVQDMDLRKKQIMLDNLKSLFNEMELVERTKGFKEYHSTSNHDEIIRKYYDVSNHVEDLIEELEEEINSNKDGK